MPAPCARQGWHSHALWAASITGPHFCTAFCVTAKWNLQTKPIAEPETFAQQSVWGLTAVLWGPTQTAILAEARQWAGGSSLKGCSLESAQLLPGHFGKQSGFKNPGQAFLPPKAVLLFLTVIISAILVMMQLNKYLNRPCGEVNGLAGTPETELYLKIPHDFETHATISYILTLGVGAALPQHWNLISFFECIYQSTKYSVVKLSANSNWI